MNTNPTITPITSALLRELDIDVDGVLNDVFCWDIMEFSGTHPDGKATYASNIDYHTFDYDLILKTYPLDDEVRDYVMTVIERENPIATDANEDDRSTMSAYYGWLLVMANDWIAGAVLKALPDPRMKIV